MPTPVKSFWIASAFISVIIGGVATWNTLSGGTLISPSTPAAQTDATTPPSEEAVLRAKMCTAIRDAVRDYAAQVPTPHLSASDRDSAVFAVYFLCMLQMPR